MRCESACGSDATFEEWLDVARYEFRAGSGVMRHGVARFAPKVELLWRNRPLFVESNLFVQPIEQAWTDDASGCLAKLIFVSMERNFVFGPFVKQRGDRCPESRKDKGSINHECFSKLFRKMVKYQLYGRPPLHWIAAPESKPGKVDDPHKAVHVPYHRQTAVLENCRQMRDRIRDAKPVVIRLRKDRVDDGTAAQVKTNLPHGMIPSLFLTENATHLRKMISLPDRKFSASLLLAILHQIRHGILSPFYRRSYHCRCFVDITITSSKVPFQRRCGEKSKRIVKLFIFLDQRAQRFPQRIQRRHFICGSARFSHLRRESRPIVIIVVAMKRREEKRKQNKR